MNLIISGVNKRPRSGQLPVRSKEDVTNDDSSRRSRSLDGDVLIPQNTAFSNYLLKVIKIDILKIAFEIGFNFSKLKLNKSFNIQGKFLKILKF